jgi:methylphosphotriester-DNA--protein-cysteine methyltransferase
MKSEPLRPETMWDAFVRRDARFDGVFVTAVRSTGIYCRPTCTCRKPRRDRVVYFRTAAAAARAGYRACKRCRPELPGGRAEADRALARAALNAMGERLEGPLTLAEIARAVAVSPSSLSRRFRAGDGRSPMRALADLRADRARALLREPARTALEAGLAVGFQSVTAFTRSFKRRFGVTPAAWRRTASAGRPLARGGKR